MKRSAKMLLALSSTMLAVPAFAQEAAPAAANNAASTAAKPKVDSAAFAARPLISRPKLSPDGKAVAFMAYPKGQETIMIVRFDGSGSGGIPIPEKMELNWFRWGGNGKILFSVSQTEFFQAEEFNRRSLISYDVATQAVKLVGKRGQGFSGDDLFYVHPDGAWGLLALQESIYDYPSVFRVDFNTGDLSRVMGARPPIWEWFADSSGVVRGGIGYRNGVMQYHYRSNEKEQFEPIVKRKFDVEGDTDFIFGGQLGAGTDEGYVLSDKKTGRSALYRFNFATRELGEQLFAPDKYDLQEVELKPDGTGPLAAYYVADYVEVKWFDPKFEKVQADIDKALGARKGYIASTSQDNSTLLVHVGASNNPGNYYHFSINEGVMNKIGAVQPEIKPAQLVPTKSVTYKARDGLDIPAYLTLPAGKQTGLPLIIMPHGGPYGIRDDMEYNAEVQFLANRGYAVLQPNYRGSGGYGRAFEKAGEGQYGRKMQDDLDDGMDWLSKQGIVDAKRVCVVGASYGGYAAMWAVTRNPERYRCAASFAGVSDLKRQIRYDKGTLYGKNRSRWQERVEGEDKFDLDQVSALPQVAKLTRPVLLAHGKEDTRVRYVQSKSYADALKKAGKDYEFYSYEKEGHGFDDPVNFKHWLDHLEAFLTKHNPA